MESASFNISVKLGEIPHSHSLNRPNLEGAFSVVKPLLYSFLFLFFYFLGFYFRSVSILLI